MKNEKRREKKKTAKAWDESGDDSDEEDISEAFKAEEARRTGTGPEDVNDGKKRDEKKKEDGPAWPIDDGGQGMISEAAPDGGGPPDQPIPIEPAVEDKKDDDEGETAILSPVPAGPESKDPAAPTARPTPAPTPNPSLQTSTPTTTTTPSTPEWRTASSRRPQKPHPIQGGRQGPIGLAHPPPIEPESKPRPNRSRQNSSRSKKAGAGNSANDAARQPQSKSQNGESAKSQPSAQTKEPRVRKEVKVRDTGMGSLADRVKNLVIGTQGSEQKKEKAASAPKSEPAATA